MPELSKAPGSRCAHQTIVLRDGCCAIFGRDDRPAVCRSFTCSWLRGFGEDDWRPDRIGVMFSVNQTAPGRVIGFAGELRDGAVRGIGLEAVVTYARQSGMPLVVVPAGEHDGPGRYVVVEDGIRDRAAAILGPLVEHLAPDVGMFERKAP